MPDELLFEKLLSEQKGYRINPIKRDGNCLFRAVADQVYDGPSLHATLRNWCANYMQEHEQFYTAFIANGSRDFTNYISHLRCDGTWGGNPEITALSEILKSLVELYRNSGTQVFKAENFHL